MHQARARLQEEESTINPQDRARARARCISLCFASTESKNVHLAVFCSSSRSFRHFFVTSFRSLKRRQRIEALRSRRKLCLLHLISIILLEVFIVYDKCVPQKLSFLVGASLKGDVSVSWLTQYDFL